MAKQKGGLAQRRFGHKGMSKQNGGRRAWAQELGKGRTEPTEKRETNTERTKLWDLVEVRISHFKHSNSENLRLSFRTSTKPNDSFYFEDFQKVQKTRVLHTLCE